MIKGALQKLWTRRKPTADKQHKSQFPPLAPKDFIYVVGDIHGRDDLLEKMLELISDHFYSTGLETCVLVCVGDYIDRGDNSAQVLNRLLTLSSEFPDQVVCLTGNHEQMMLDFLREPEARGRRWFRNGGLQTLASYSIGGVWETSPEPELVRARDQLLAAMPDGLESWICNLPLIYQNGNVVVTHAGADPLLSLDDQETNALLWGSSRFMKAERTDGNWIVYGHQIVDTPTVEGGRISTDTGAYATGRLTAAAISPTGDVTFLTAQR